MADIDEEEVSMVEVEQRGNIMGRRGNMSGDFCSDSPANATQRAQDHGEEEVGELIEETSKKGESARNRGMAERSIEVEDEDEEDDVDFNPYLLRSPSREASSAGSSEVEEEGEEVDDGRNDQEIPGAEVEGVEDFEAFELEDDDEFLELGSEVDEEEFVDDEDDDNEEEEEDEEEENLKGEGGQISSSQQEWRDAIEVDLGEQVNECLIQRQGLDGNLRAVWCSDSREALDKSEKERLSASIFDYNTKYSSAQERVEEEMMMGRALEGLPELRSPRSDWGQQMDASQQRTDEEEVIADAISKRTRAHYSLADMSLDQLETFLQESDEEDYFQNVDDEEEYRKFLAAVQEKIDTEEDANKQEKAIEEESESEDEDADFEIEIEEALESDCEEGLDGDGRKRKRGRRPETREKRRQRAKLQNKVRLLGLAKAPLRPLLPYAGGMPANASAAEWSKIMADKASKPWASSIKRQPPVNGFTAHQIGQLYCLMHEHVQLLIQVFAMCISEPGRQEVALDTHRMLMELAEKRESVLSWKKSAFPDFCFRPPYTHPSVTENAMPSFEGESLVKLLSGNSPIPNAYPPSALSSSVPHQQVVTDILPSISPNISFPQSPTLGSASDLKGQPISPCQYSNPFNHRDHRDQVTFPMPSSSHSPPSSLSLSLFSDSTSKMFLGNGLSTNASQVQENATSAYNGASSAENLLWGLTSLSSEEAGATNPLDYSYRNLSRAIDFHSSSLQTKSTDSSYAIVTSNDLAVVSNESALPSSSTLSPSSPSEWVPATSGPVRSLLDVAPLALVREFLADVAQLVQENRQQLVEGGAFSIQCEKGPLFAVRVQVDQGPQKAIAQIQQVHMLQAPQVKKTMAAALVESTKKQTIALVPKDVAAAMQRFLTLFNEGLFPHKAPPASTASRLLFTDAEDELLAMGLMTYNTDWKAIQQRFLPSKSMHQIFVRQKNRSSARAPENSIKAVRRMKSSPLTVDEKACIQEALKVFKYNWTKVWQFCVPHRDPATLPRQWRIALGTQKSYKSSETNKEKRRVYEAGRRQAIAAQKDGIVGVQEELPALLGNDADRGHEISVDEDGEAEDAYTDGAFLGVGNPPSSRSSLAGCSPVSEPDAPSAAISLNSESKHLRVDGATQTVSSSHSPALTVTSSRSPRPVQAEIPYMPPTYTTSRHPSKQTVKLAPGLPPLKLPPTVRVLSQFNTGDLKIHSSNAIAVPQFQQNCSPWGRPVKHAIGMAPAAVSLPSKDQDSVTTRQHLTGRRKAPVQVQEYMSGSFNQAQELSKDDSGIRILDADKQAACLDDQDALVEHQQSPQDLPGRSSMHLMLFKASDSPARNLTVSPNSLQLREAGSLLHSESPQGHSSFGSAANAREPSQVVSHRICRKLTTK